MVSLPSLIWGPLERTRNNETLRPGTVRAVSLKGPGRRSPANRAQDFFLSHKSLPRRDSLPFQMVHYWRITILKINYTPYERDQIKGNMLLCFPGSLPSQTRL